MSTAPVAAGPCNCASLVGFVSAIIGSYFICGGIQLLSHSGSGYDLPAGVALPVTAILLFRANVRAGHVYFAFFFVTIAWAFWELGFHFWPLAARLGIFALLGLLIALCMPKLSGAERIVNIRPIASQQRQLVSQPAPTKLPNGSPGSKRNFNTDHSGNCPDGGRACLLRAHKGHHRGI